jgi:RNAse (barnase) inhibitor barstar
LIPERTEQDWDAAMADATYEIDGQRIGSIADFYDQIDAQLLSGTCWGRNLDAFNDILWGGFGPLPERFTLVWRSAADSHVGLWAALFDKLVNIVHQHENVTLELA